MMKGRGTYSGFPYQKIPQLGVVQLMLAGSVLSTQNQDPLLTLYPPIQ